MSGFEINTDLEDIKHYVKKLIITDTGTDSGTNFFIADWENQEVTITGSNKDITMQPGSIEIDDNGQKIILSGWKVGIGNNNPSTKLDVSWDIKSNGYKLMDSTSQHTLDSWWYTIAKNQGNRAAAKFAIREKEGGHHQAVHFYAAHHYWHGNNITVLSDSNYWNNWAFKHIRIKEGGTYDWALLQVYVDANSISGIKGFVYENVQDSGWSLVDWESTDPISWLSEVTRINLDENNWINSTQWAYFAKNLKINWNLEIQTWAIEDGRIVSDDIKNDTIKSNDLSHDLDASSIWFNADKLDGKESTDFVSVNWDTMKGDLNFWWVHNLERVNSIEVDSIYAPTGTSYNPLEVKSDIDMNWNSIADVNNINWGTPITSSNIESQSVESADTLNWSTWENIKSRVDYNDQYYYNTDTLKDLDCSNGEVARYEDDGTSWGWRCVDNNSNDSNMPTDDSWCDSWTLSELRVYDSGKIYKCNSNNITSNNSYNEHAAMLIDSSSCHDKAKTRCPSWENYVDDDCNNAWVTKWWWATGWRNYREFDSVTCSTSWTEYNTDQWNW